MDFSKFSLACISGTNGAGKSSLLDAITWSLFGNARRNDDAIINSHSDTAEVGLEFLYEGETYQVIRRKQRNKTTTLEFQILSESGGWKSMTEKSIRETEVRINETLKMDYETFINASFFLQGKADQFAQQKPSDRKRILGSILGLEKWDKYLKEAIIRRKRVEEEISGFNGRLAEIDGELSEEDQRKQNLVEVETRLALVSDQRIARETSLQGYERLEAALNEQKRILDRLEKDLQGLVTQRSELAGKLAERENEIAADEALLRDEPEIDKQYLEWEALRSRKETLEALSTKFRQLEARRQPLLQEVAAERGRLQAELNNLRTLAGEADTINREIAELKNAQPEKEKAVDELQQKTASRPVHEAERQSVLETIANLQAENNRLFTAMEELKERITRLTVVEGADCPLCGQTLTEDHCKELLVSLEAEGKTQADIHRQNQRQMKELTETKLGLENQIRSCDQAAIDLQNAQRVLDQSLTRLTMLQEKSKDAESAADSADKIQVMLQAETFSEDQRIKMREIEGQIAKLAFDEKELENITTRENSLRPVVEKRQLIAQAKSHLEPLRREVESIKAQLADVENSVLKNTREFEESQAKYNDCASGMPDLLELRAEVAKIRDEENRLISELGGARQKVQVLNTLRKRRVEINEKKQESAQEVSRYKTLEKAFGKDGVQALLIEEALPEIETKANDILDRLSGGTMSVRFETQKDYKDKSREDKRETLDILISDGAGMRVYEMFSGGEAFRVNFAIRLALSQELAHRAGARLQTLVIDEGFGSQDVDGRQRLIETINLVQEDFAKILVITHLEELKDVFPARIEVEKTLRGSQVTVA